MMRHVCLTTAVLFALLGQPAEAADSSVPGCAALGGTSPKPANQHAVPGGGYPALSLVLHEEGSTTVSFVVKEDGATADAAVSKTSGSLRLDEASLEAIKTWLYHPATRDGKPIACRSQAAVLWKLHDEGAGMWLFVNMTTKDFPPDALKNNESGTTYLVVLLPLGGKEVKPVVVRSSGFDDLDQAAVSLATAKSHLTAAQFDGKAAWTYMPLAIVWAADKGKDQ